MVYNLLEYIAHKDYKDILYGRQGLRSIVVILADRIYLFIITDHRA